MTQLEVTISLKNVARRFQEDDRAATVTCRLPYLNHFTRRKSKTVGDCAQGITVRKYQRLGVHVPVVARRLAFSQNLIPDGRTLCVAL